MDIAKNLLGFKPHGYGGRGTKADTLSEDEDDSYFRKPRSTEPIGVSVTAPTNAPLLSVMGRPSGQHVPTAGGPFSALTPTMWPQDVLSKMTQVENSADQMDFRYDEFGFRVEEEDGAEPNSSKILSQPLSEDPQHRLKWTAHLQFMHNNEDAELTWDKVDTVLPRSDKLKQLVRDGIPHSMRAQLWMRLSGAQQKKLKTETSYINIVKASSDDHTHTAKLIEKDLLRTMPSNACFSRSHSCGIPRLRRILRGLAWLYPDIGYCQGTGMIAASLLLFMEEDDVFWVMCAIIEDLVPGSYYSNTLIGVQADQRVLRQLIISLLPKLDVQLKSHDIELSLITLHWFLTAFASVVHIKILLRIWDLFFFDGSVVLFQITFGLLKMKEDELVSIDNSAQIFNTLSDLPSDIEDVDELIEVSLNTAGSLTDVFIEAHRRKHLAYLMAEQGALVNPETANNLPKQHVQRRTLKRSRSMMSYLFSVEESDYKEKNIRQTELVSNMRDAILQVARHFQSIDPKNYEFSLQADYSMESHQKDHEDYVLVARNRRRRAKALLDFERHDDDELGFRKNDIITIISMKDEHCWVGELNGLRGWFPAKFVELLDERSKQYTSAGDDQVTEGITDLVRGCLCPQVKNILEHGMKKSSIIGGICHPWLFIEEAARREVERDFDSVYSRLVLCKTYRLDEDGKVLTPEELLYRAVHAINLTHEKAHVQMDVKLRTWICIGLNEQVLHLWLETLASCENVVNKWYHRGSFLRSPGWVQIKCELRILSKFAFSLSEDWELPVKKEVAKPLKEGVRDMLVKHHLFSWDL